MIKNEQIKQAVKQAIKDNEIIPFYQPKVDVNNGRLVGAEALSCWCNKQGKVIPPNEFIPIYEKIGLITDIDMAIFEEVLIFLKKNLESV